jgi:MFS family permease
VVPYYLAARHVGFALVGLRLSILPLALGIAAPFAGRLVSRTGDRPLTGGGLLLTAAGLLEIALWHGTIGLLIGLALTGLGLGAFTPANNATIMSASPPGHTGVISGVLNMTRGIGTALGVALAGALYIAAAGASAVSSTPATDARGLSVTFTTLGAIALAVGLALLCIRSKPPNREVQR